MKKKLSLIVLTITTLILQIIPYSAVLVFAIMDPETNQVVKSPAFYSYFDPINLGYANFGVFVAAILTVLILVLTVLYLFNNKIEMIITITSSFAMITSTFQVLLFLQYVHIIGYIIPVLLLIVAIISLLRPKDNNWLIKRQEVNNS